MALGALVQTILGFVALVCVGTALRGFGLVAREDARPLNAVIIYVGLPAFVFRAVHGTALTAESMTVVVISWIVFAALLGVSLLASRLLSLSAEKAGGFTLAASLGNTGYLGYRLSAAMLGLGAIPLAVLYDVFGTVMQLVLVAIPLTRHTVGRRGEGLGGTLRDLVTFPALLAALAAFALSGVAVPNPVRDWLDLVAKMVAPLVLISVGISLRPRAVAHAAPALATLAAIRLLAGPVVALVAVTLLAPGAGVGQVAMLQAGMPSMMLSLAVGERLGLDGDFIAASVFVTTVVSAVSIPVVQLLLGR